MEPGPDRRDRDEHHESHAIYELRDDVEPHGFTSSAWRFEMAALTANEENAVNSVVQALTNDSELKQIFCQCWPCAKKLLELLAARVPEPLKSLIEGSIRIGDAAHGRVCG
jgi:hypothetical protein